MILDKTGLFAFAITLLTPAVVSDLPAALLLYVNPRSLHPVDPPPADFALKVARLSWRKDGKLEADLLITKETRDRAVFSSEKLQVEIEWNFFAANGDRYSRTLACICWHSLD